MDSAMLGDHHFGNFCCAIPDTFHFFGAASAKYAV